MACLLWLLWQGGGLEGDTRREPPFSTSDVSWWEGKIQGQKGQRLPLLPLSSETFSPSGLRGYQTTPDP